MTACLSALYLPSMNAEVSRAYMMKENYWQSHDFINQLIEQIPAAIFWKDKNSVFLGCNRFFANLAAIPDPKDIIGKTDFDLPWGKFQADRYIADDREVMLTQKPKLNIEESQTLNDGQEYVLLTNKIPLFDDHGDVIGILAIFHDITRRKNMERSLEQAKIYAEQANNAKSEFIANMSHDIRTPLTGVIGLSHHLHEQLVDPHSKQIAKWIYDSGEQLLGLLNSVLDLVDMDNTRDEDLKYEIFHLDTLINELIELHFPAVISKGIELKTNFDKNISFYIRADRSKLYRILLNLFSNAIKFTDYGKVETEINLLSIESNRAHIQFKIMDTGIGIPLELQPFIFERFYRAHPSYKGVFKGHGLGLHIAKKYIELMGGGLQVHSIPKKGSTFYFDLWMDIVAEPKKLNKKISNLNLINDISEQNHNDIQLMLVEDNTIAQKMIEIFAKSLGVKLDIYQTAHSAFEAFQKKKYHMLITDIGLPDCSGYELAQMIRTYEKKLMLAEVPIIGVTAHATNAIKGKCLINGIKDILSKPISKQMLNKMISIHCGLDTSNIQSEHEDQNLNQSTQHVFYFASYEQYPLFNWNIALNRFGTEKVAEDMLKIFLQEDLLTAKQKTTQLFQIYDLGPLWSIVHRIHGGTVYCGTERLNKITRHLESAISEKKEMAIKNLFPLWHYILETTIVEIEKQMMANQPK